MQSPFFTRSLVSVALVLTGALGAIPTLPQDDVQEAFDSLIEADHWRKRNAARDRRSATRSHTTATASRARPTSTRASRSPDPESVVADMA